MNILFLIGFIAALAVVSPVPLIIEETALKIVETIDEPKCTSTIQGLRYNVEATNCTVGYVECISFGKGIYKECRDDTIYDSHKGTCIEATPKAQSNETWLPMVDVSNTTWEMFNQTEVTWEPMSKVSNETWEATNETDGVLWSNVTESVERREIPLEAANETEVVPMGANGLLEPVANVTDSPKEAVFEPVVRREVIEVFNETSNTQTNNDTSIKINIADNNTIVDEISFVGVPISQDAPVEENWKRDLLSVTVDVPNCMNTCQYGICDKFSSESGCICLVNFTGAACDQLVEKERIYTEILADTFTLEHYLEHHYFENGTVRGENVSMSVEGAKIQTPNSLLPVNATSNYFGLFWTEVVDHMWGELLPEHHFLRNMSCDQFSVPTLGTQFQRLYYYSQYVNENFQERLVLMEAILVKFKFLLGDKSQVVKEDAVMFLTQWKNYLKVIELAALDTTAEDEEWEVEKFSQSQMKDEISVQMNETYTLARQAYQTFVAKQSNGNVEESSEVLEELVVQVKEASVKAWSVVVDYGFWFMTYHLAVTDESVKLNMNTLLSENLDFYSWMHQKHHHVSA